MLYSFNQRVGITRLQKSTTILIVRPGNFGLLHHIPFGYESAVPCISQNPLDATEVDKVILLLCSAVFVLLSSIATLVFRLLFLGDVSIVFCFVK